MTLSSESTLNFVGSTRQQVPNQSLHHRTADKTSKQLPASSIFNSSCTGAGQPYIDPPAPLSLPIAYIQK
ncbi:hypothetical protein HaLaN_12847 [Haematococcus lacustris]|uniref:Uncharacterized protein n=1 Tax=Haematococcus lacustris TaxID=44745 RepID=A0A699ZBJ4_HAELA|nr:hypothetical protein HaLaN_12847 [Haematococcus lacustris]